MSDDPKAEAMSIFGERQSKSRKDLVDEIINWYDVSYGKIIGAHMLLAWSALHHEESYHKDIASYGQFMIDKGRNLGERDDYPADELQTALATANNQPSAESLYRFVSLFTHQELEAIGI